MTALLILATGAAGYVARRVPEVPGILVAYGRYAATWIGLTNIIYVGEGLNAFVAVSETTTGVRNYHNAGKVQASSEPQDMRLQRMLGHFTHLIPKSPKNALVIGCGAGVTAGAVSIGPGVEHMTIAEIEPLVPASVSKYFGEHNYEVVDNPKVTIHIDDARHFLLHDRPDVRCDHLGSARSVGQGRRDTLHARVLGSRQAAPESRRRRHGIRAALREQSGGREERDRHVPRSVSARRRLGQYEQRAGLRPRADGPGRADQRSTSTSCRPSSTARRTCRSSSR